MAGKCLRRAPGTVLMGAWLALAACNGEDEGGDGGTLPDTGLVEMDGGMNDAGARDGGRGDGGLHPADASVPACPPGTEGCACHSSVTADTDPFVFQRDDCASADLLCVPFDIGYQVTAPVQGCVKPCTTDNQCGAGRICRESGYPRSTGIGRICFDDQAPIDNFCHLSRLTTSRLVVDGQPIPIESGAVMRACPIGTTCQSGIFSDVHPDEGICANFCTRNEECNADAPYCNPRLLTRTSSTGMRVPLGICSFKKLGPGALCGTATVGAAGLATRCDSADDDLACLRVRELFPGNTGLCAQVCGSSNPCTGEEPGVGPYHCQIADNTDAMRGGYCVSSCTSYPDHCEGNGAGFGRFCLDRTLTINTVPVSFCMDRQGPLLRQTIVDRQGNVVRAGDDCSNTPSVDFARCPEPGTCSGACVIGCAPGQIPTGCEMFTATGTICTALPAPNQNRGYCTTN